MGIPSEDPKVLQGDPEKDHHYPTTRYPTHLEMILVGKICIPSMHHVVSLRGEWAWHPNFTQLRMWTLNRGFGISQDYLCTCKNLKKSDQLVV